VSDVTLKGQGHDRNTQGTISGKQLEMLFSNNR